MSFPRPARAAEHVWFGLGRATMSNKIKFFRFISFVGDHGTCEIFTLGDGGGSGWTWARSPPAKIYDANKCSDGVTVKGVLHFLSKSQDDILCFDLEIEERTAIRRPLVGTPSYSWEKISLAELNDALCLSHTKQYMVNLWLLTKLNNDDDWVKAYTISVNHEVGFVPLGLMHPAEKLLFYYWSDYIYGLAAVLYEYDPHSGKCTAIEKAPTDIVGRICLCGS